MNFNPYGVEIAEKLKQDPELSLYDVFEAEAPTVEGASPELGDERELEARIKALKRTPGTKLSNDPLGEFVSKYHLTKEKVHKMEQEHFIYDNLLIKGHILTLAARPGAGKTTLLFYEVAPALAKQGLKVLYCDADNPALQKRDMAFFAEEKGFYLIDPYETSITEFLKGLKETINQAQSLADYVFVYDTLKKYASLFDKGRIKDFFIFCRKLTKLGGTVVLAAHTNKYPDSEGRPIFEGVADVLSDSDELLYLDGRQEGDKTVCTVLTEPSEGAKVRGFFHNWSFEIVRSPDEAPKIRRLKDVVHVRTTIEEEVLQTASMLLSEIGELPITALADLVRDETGLGIQRVRNILRAKSTPEGDTTPGKLIYRIGDKGKKLIRLP